jgi:hypothetical protein
LEKITQNGETIAWNGKKLPQMGEKSPKRETIWPKIQGGKGGPRYRLPANFFPKNTVNRLILAPSTVKRLILAPNTVNH